jgi:hypothetical protein
VLIKSGEFFMSDTNNKDPKIIFIDERFNPLTQDDALDEAYDGEYAIQDDSDYNPDNPTNTPEVK